MEISRQNYEQFFVDYLDGKLNNEQVGDLMSFLEFNPDLKEELAGIEKICLVPDETAFSGKARLLKSESDLTEAAILKDFDMYCISSMENDIADDDEEILQGIIRDDPDREATYMLYNSTRLLPDESILYPGKARLKKRFITIPYRIIMPAAAAVAALLIILQVFTGNGPELENLNMAEQIPENSQDEMGTQSPVTKEDQLPYDNQPLAEGKKLPETSPVRPAIISDKQSVPVKESLPDAESYSGREKIQLAMVRSKSIDRVEGSTANSDQTDMAYQALRQNFSREDQDKVEDPSGDNPKLSLWILADAGVRGLNSVSEDEYHLDRKKDNNGRTRRFTFDSPVFGISAPLRKPDKGQ
jgi:hypothetical protein